MDNRNTNPKVTTRVKAQARVARYRAKTRRIDYAPAKDVLELIERTRTDNPGCSYQSAIDFLLKEAEHFRK